MQVPDIFAADWVTERTKGRAERRGYRAYLSAPMLREKDAIDVITDAASAHRGAGTTPKDIALHAEVTSILDRIVAGGNSVRRS